MTRIIEREEIILTPHLSKMIESGWGGNVLHNTVVESIVYLSDGLRVKGFLAYPKNLPEGMRLPCVMWNRGGAKNRGAFDRFTAKGMYGLIASWGYVVFASSYRGSLHGEGEEEFGGADVNDIHSLKVAANELPICNTNEWGIEGWSRGGMMTGLVLLQDPGYQCAVFVGAITNLEEYAGTSDSFAVNYRSLIQGGNFQDEIQKRTIITKAALLPKETKYLLIHGGADETIPVTQTLEFALALEKNKYTYRTIVVEYADHYLKNARRDVDAERFRWYKKYLPSPFQVESYQ